MTTDPDRQMIVEGTAQAATWKEDMALAKSTMDSLLPLDPILFIQMLVRDNNALKP